MHQRPPAIDDLRSAIQSACQPQNVHRIVAGRQAVMAMPREWVLQSIEQTVAGCLDLSDDWQYRRLLELAGQLDDDLVRRFVAIGSRSDDENVLEAARDFQK
ncbi:hypothetical protein LOC67_24795 [Stieleria sp. JC731]|uniref:hypothetical protein n=1 Tax=Stieleria sp. JC731 TaxID=2894195 RepID=UPI001E28F649|nr:hypothetical protein [Stieleria sp. JC731]MCC9603782.1 hypothetical protein [Stieleria sp. JC731]